MPDGAISAAIMWWPPGTRLMMAAPMAVITA
jgi:hypothetical protein